ncbi:MAG: BLUF domain-containing protein [Hyphomicrobiales bacterium]
MLVRCLYASRASGPVTAAVMDRILEQSRRNNVKFGVTGLLCVSEDIYIQVLEGGRDEVGDLFSRIIRDDRHTHVRLLAFQEIPERHFGSWTMGQVNASKINPSLLLKYSDRAALNPFGCPARATMALLEELVSTAAIATRGN